jgi:hypothetical protein
VSGGGLETQLDRPYAQQPAIRDAARSRIGREKDADFLLDVLGLVDDPGPLVIDGRQACPRCRKPLPDPIANGGHKPCRRRACMAAAAEEAGSL